MAELTQEEKTEVEYWLSLENEALQVEIGRTLLRAEGVQHSPQAAIAATLEWVEEKKDLFRSKICDEWDFCEKRKDEKYKDRVTFVAAITDVISASLTGVPPFAIGTLLIKMGLERICECSD